MNTATPSVPAAEAAAPVARKSAAGGTPDPWIEIARLEYGADRSFAWPVREEVIHGQPEHRAAVEAKLLEALAVPDCTVAGRAFICEMLALVGSAKCVPALAPLLKNPESAHAARVALEPIPGPEATEALRDSLPHLDGDARAGVVGSLAVRGEKEAAS